MAVGPAVKGAPESAGDEGPPTGDRATSFPASGPGPRGPGAAGPGGYSRWPGGGTRARGEDIREAPCA